MKLLILTLTYLSTITSILADINISGNIRKSGNYKIEGEMPLSEIIDLAGGISIFGDSVIVYRDDAKAGHIHVFAGYRRLSDKMKSFTVKDGDIIHVGGKAPFGIDIPEFITNAAKAKNKTCYKIEYRSFILIEKENKPK